ncbi:MAG: glycosyltransferase family 2 protein [Cyanobacteriota bacterium]|nr:glycosyltransferase family 2 protein [Cyanobacteriota bacterium]
MEIAVLIPCFNEASSIYEVVAKLRHQLHSARIVVCDNASTDGTAERARAAGAEVMYEERRGKGNAMRRLFRDVEADIYIMIDGDNTYGTEILADAIALVRDEGCDMVVGTRRFGDIPQRRGHNAGNQLFTRFFQTIFDVRSEDVFSGLRIFSRRLIKTFPCTSLEFEVEAELEIYCARMLLPTAALPVTMRPRQGNFSKLNTWRDGFKILWLSIRMLHREYPLRLYAMLGSITGCVALLQMVPVTRYYLDTGLVPRFPTLIACSVLLALSIASIGMGLILKEITNNRYEMRYLRYLSYS